MSTPVLPTNGSICGRRRPTETVVHTKACYIISIEIDTRTDSSGSETNFNISFTTESHIARNTYETCRMPTAYTFVTVHAKIMH